jgi:hypothetical protein
MTFSHDLFHIDPSIDSRAITFENPTGARGAGGQAANGRKGAPMKSIAPGECVVLCDIEGPGVVRHVWMAISPAPPTVSRAQVLEVFYGDATEPSISVPVLDFFAAAHGRPSTVNSAIVAIQEGRGFNSYIAMPFRERIRIEYTNHAEQQMTLYYQIDLTLESSLPKSAGYLHATFRRQNPTVLTEDFVIAEGIEGPGRYLGCVVGIRILDKGMWYGEGEVKIYKDGDKDFPTICGTGLEDYAGTAWGMGQHCAPYAGVPLDLRQSGTDNPLGDQLGGEAKFASFYRWHVLDPIMYAKSLKVTIQQIGAAMFESSKINERLAYEANHPVAGNGWMDLGPVALGIVERVDDYCATAFIYATRAQAVTRVDVVDATADLDRLDFEQPDPFEAFSSLAAGGMVADAELPGGE